MLETLRKALGPEAFALACAAALGVAIAGGSRAEAAPPSSDSRTATELAELRAEMRIYFRSTDQRLERIESFIDGRR